MESEGRPLTIACSTVSVISVIAIAASYWLGSQKPLRPRLAAALSLPAAIFSTGVCLADVARGIPILLSSVLTRILVPLATAAVASHLWSGSADLELAIEAEAALFSRALEGSGITFTTAIIAGQHTVALFADGVTPMPADTPLGNKGLPPLILLAGYGGGAAFFSKNLRAIVSGYGGPVFAVDWRGTGCSPRTKWTAKGSQEAESFFIDGLLAWRDTLKLGHRRVILAGHSLGGALSLATWIQNPQLIAGLVLLSPACLGPGVFAAATAATDVPVDAASATNSSSNSALSQNQNERHTAPFAGRPRLRKALLSLAKFSWELGVTPGSMIRSLGPCGLRCVRASLSARSTRWAKTANGPSPVDKASLNDLGIWLYHTQASPGCGEYALRHIFKPGAEPRDPLVPRLRAALDANQHSPIKTPFIFAYGASDWMPVSGGHACVDALQSEGHEASVEIVNHAGHHLCEFFLN